MSPLFEHILAPLDFTEKNLAALDAAIEIGKSQQARLTLLHVIETIEPDPSGEIENFYSMLETKARGKLRELVEQLERHGATVSQEIVYGQRAAEIVRYAMNEHVSLVVMSSHKVDLARAQNRASLSHQVSILCQCPVLLVK